MKNLKAVQLDPKEEALLKFVKQLTLSPADMHDSDVEALREVGYTDEQIWEASLEVGMFSMLNRMADVYGLDYPSRGWLPPETRKQKEKEKETAEKKKTEDNK